MISEELMSSVGEVLALFACFGLLRECAAKQKSMFEAPNLFRGIVHNLMPYAPSAIGDLIYEILRIF